MSATLTAARRGPSPVRGGGNRRVVLTAGAAGLVAAALVWLVAFSPVLAARTVTIRGTALLTPAQVRAAAAVGRQPLVRLDTAAVARRVEALPEVASARVETSYPSTVVITVQERVAVGYLIASGGNVLVDRTGEQFRTVPDRPHGLPLFVVPDGPQATQTGAALASVAAALPPGVLRRVASVQAFDPTAITLLLTDRRVVRWGSAERTVDKARLLPVLLSQPGTQIDLTDPDEPFTR